MPGSWAILRVSLLLGGFTGALLGKGKIDSPAALVKAAKRQGFKVEQKKKGWMVKTPNGQGSVMIHKTLSDHRGLKNAIARLRRYGFEPPGR